MRTLSPETLGAQRPQNSIPPGGVKADGDQLLIPLHAVDGQLPGGGGGPNGGGVVDQIEHEGGQTEAGCRCDPLSGDKEDADGME